MLGLPIEGLGPLLDAVSKPPLEGQLTLRLLIDAERAPLLRERTASRANVEVVVPGRGGVGDVSRAIDGLDLVCLPLPADAWGRGLSTLPVVLALSRGVPVALSAGAACAIAAGVEVLQVDGDEGWSEALATASEDRGWLRDLSARGRDAVLRRHNAEEAYAGLLAVLLRAARRADGRRFFAV